MRRTRLAAPIALSLVVASSVTGPVSAAGPEVIVTPPHGRTGESIESGSSPKVRSGRTTQSAPGANGRIAFVRSPFQDFPNALWSMQATGAFPMNLTPGGAGWGDLWPAYSPGGTMIAFTRDTNTTNADLDGDIFVMQSDGTGVKRLTNTSTSDVSPVWTPDGSRIVFTSHRTGGGDIYSMRIDGTDVKRLTSSADGEGYPSVSPDGKKIAYAAGPAVADSLDIYTMNIDGTGRKKLTTVAGNDYQPEWSPDGTKIAFTSARVDGILDVFVMNADGSNQTNLTADPDYDDLEPTWSPDGTQLAFWSFADADADIYVVPAAGGTQTPVGATADDEFSPDWQPLPSFPLVDARFSIFKADIEWVYGQDITRGCSFERYCPDDPVTREQMAIFLDRALKLPTTTTDSFSDDTGKTGEAAINRVAAAGITSGCAPTKYCPTDTVTRGAMASFLARAFHLPATTTDYFTDDTGTTHEANINRVKAAGITSGCTPTTYCPSADVTRGQMAAFLRRALE